MTTYTGNDGVIKIGANTVGEARDWSINESAGVLEDSVLGDTAESYLPNKTAFTGTINALFDEADAGQAAITVGATVAFELFPRGETTGDPRRSGSGIITAVNETAAHDGLIEASFEFQGSGDLTKDTAP